MKAERSIALAIIIFISGCVAPSQKLFRPPLPSASQRMSITPQVTQSEPTFEPTSTCFYIDSQEVKDLVDAAEGDLIAANAIRRLEDAIRKNIPGIQNTSVYLTLGTRYEDLDNMEKAIDSYTKAINLCDINAVAYLFRGELFYKQGDYKQASQDLHKALDVKPPWSLDAYYADEARYYLKEIEDHHTT